MNKQLPIILVLTLVAVLASGLLTFFAVYTQPYIEKNAQQALRLAVSEVLPGISTYNEIQKEENFSVYKGLDSQGVVVGYAVYSSGSGFQDKIALIFGISSDFSKLLALKILDQKETPGLGAKITDPKVFLQFWKNRSLLKELTYVKPPRPLPSLAENEINAISGATISSQAVVRIVNQAFTKVKSQIGDQR